MALFLGGFTLLNLAGNFVSTSFNANLWWIDLRSFPAIVSNVFLFVAAACLVAYAINPPRSAWRTILTIGCSSLLAIKSLIDAMVFFRLVANNTLTTAVPVPLSVFICAGLLLIVIANLRKPSTGAQNPTGIRPLAQVALVFFGCSLAFPLAQMFCFGKTDYRRQADVAVVFGARVYVDGRLSDALADRVGSACRLYREGLVKRLLFSGGPGDGAWHETEAMKRMAMESGVRAEDIILDHSGLNTQATVKNSEPIFTRLRAKRVLVVSHFYHLPRIKLAYQRVGWEVYTVPAKESYFLRQMPYNIAREVAALWVYYLRPLAVEQT